MSSVVVAGSPNSKNIPSSSNEKVLHVDDEEVVIGGGSINEKKRRYYDSKITTTTTTTSTETRNQQSLNEKEEDENKKTRGFHPQSQNAHLLHALVGLDRYPNYISRWNYNLVEDVERLENALEEQLQKVRDQKERLIERNSSVRNLVMEAQESIEFIDGEEDDENDIDWDILKCPKTWEEIRENVLDPRCADAIFQSKMFRHMDKPSVADVLDGKVKVELDEAQCGEWLEQEMYDVYSFPLLSPSFCIKLKKVMKRLIHVQQQKLKQLENYSEEGSIDNASIGVRPIDVDMMGASWINNLLFHLVVRPLSRHLFQKTESMNDLDWRQGYIVGYSHKPSEKDGIQRQRLVPHTDDSEVTLNIGMGDNFEGGDLAFWGLRNTEGEGSFVGDFHPIIGTALLHSGRHLHEVKHVTKGDRFAYIMWARSWKGVRSMTCPCCWLNRRQPSPTSDSSIRHTCICAPKWN